MNWGVKIIIFLGAFMLFIIGSVVYMISSDSDELEEKDYYEQAINYDVRYGKKQNMVRDQSEPEIDVKAGELTLSFVQDIKEGALQLKRSADGSMDQNISLEGGKSIYNIDISKLERGQWVCILEWTEQSTDYRLEKDIYL